MITKKDAIAILISITKAAKLEIDSYSAVAYDSVRVPAIRGALFRALDNLWYEILTLRVREQFHVEGNFNNRENFLNIARQILND